MDEEKRQRCIYVTARQKKKLIELMSKHPELIACKVTQDFNYKDSQKLWKNIASECNSMPGARKTWRQWKRTWQDLRSKAKKRLAENNGSLPISAILSEAEQSALGIKNVSSSNSDNLQESAEFSPIEQDDLNDNYNDDINLVESDESESPPEVKVFTQPALKPVKMKNNYKMKHSNNGYYNFDMLAAQEQKKIQIKEDYWNFKKDYLRQKLQLMKEQTEALKSIALELSK